jgi:hypothetical protein
MGIGAAVAELLAERDTIVNMAPVQGVERSSGPHDPCIMKFPPSDVRVSPGR